MEVIKDAPAADSFIPLATYQSQTPESFFSGPPVLHHHSSSATAQIQAKELLSAPILQNLFNSGAEANLNGAAATNGHGEEDEDDHVVETSNVDIWVTSDSKPTPPPSTTTTRTRPSPSPSFPPLFLLKFLPLQPLYPQTAPLPNPTENRKTQRKRYTQP
ncbi:MAG: hypothetical protein Q9191_003814 [Dirinaria sp. TL-2023a]